MENRPVVRQNEARRLLNDIYADAGNRKHPFWNDCDPAHAAWVSGFTKIEVIANGEDI